MQPGVTPPSAPSLRLPEIRGLKPAAPAGIAKMAPHRPLHPRFLLEQPVSKVSIALGKMLKCQLRPHVSEAACLSGSKYLKAHLHKPPPSPIPTRRTCQVVSRTIPVPLKLRSPKILAPSWGRAEGELDSSRCRLDLGVRKPYCRAVLWKEGTIRKLSPQLKISRRKGWGW